jgi:hypothetical protein
MRRTIATLTATLALAAGLTSLPAHAAPGDSLERLLDGGVVEALVARALAGMDFDALLGGFEQSARAAAEGRAPDPGVLAQSQARIEQRMAQVGPALGRDAAGVLVPVLQQLRMELMRELATPSAD